MALDHDTHNLSRTVRRTSWRLGALGAAALLLASCGTAASVSSAPVTGVPSIGISVPLQQVACTLHDSCIAVGGSTASSGPSTVGEYRQTSGRWVTAAVPPATSAQITAGSCWASDCLLAGAQSSGDLLWDYQGATHTVSTVAVPAGGVAVIALDCYAALTCVMFDSDANGRTRVVSTLDGGTTWTPPALVGWADGDTVTALACHSANDCLAAATTATKQVVVEGTHDGGFTWTALTTPSAWTALNSLTCRVRSCVGLATTSDGARVVRTTTFGRTWHGVAVSANATALACTTLTHCVAVGQTSSGSPWLAQVRRDIVTSRSLRYVPSPLLDVACGTSTCAAIGVTTLLALKP